METRLRRVEGRNKRTRHQRRSCNGTPAGRKLPSSSSSLPCKADPTERPTCCPRLCCPALVEHEHTPNHRQVQKQSGRNRPSFALVGLVSCVISLVPPARTTLMTTQSIAPHELSGVVSIHLSLAATLVRVFHNGNARFDPGLSAIDIIASLLIAHELFNFYLCLYLLLLAVVVVLVL